MDTGISVDIECLAIVGKNNGPLYIRNFTDKKDLELHYFVHLSLDALEAKLSETPPSRDSYLGLLFSMENRNVYYFCTSGNVKLLGVIRWRGRPPHDDGVRTLLANFHKLYVRLVCNPFYQIGAEVGGAIARRFEEQVASLAMAE